MEGLQPRMASRVARAQRANPQSVYDQQLMNGTHEQVQNIE
jgi:hypothetical protein